MITVADKETIKDIINTFPDIKERITKVLEGFTFEDSNLDIIVHEDGNAFVDKSSFHSLIITNKRLDVEKFYTMDYRFLLLLNSVRDQLINKPYRSGDTHTSPEIRDIGEKIKSGFIPFDETALKHELDIIGYIFNKTYGTGPINFYLIVEEELKGYRWIQDKETKVI